MGLERLEDVQKVQRVIEKRFARFGLKINASKTRLVRYQFAAMRGAFPLVSARIVHSFVSRTRNLRNRMRQTRSSGSVGASPGLRDGRPYPGLRRHTVPAFRSIRLFAKATVTA